MPSAVVSIGRKGADMLQIAFGEDYFAIFGDGIVAGDFCVFLGSAGVRNKIDGVTVDID